VPDAEYLFVYGTLRRGVKNKFSELLAAKSQFLDEARLAGRLYDFGEHPGAVLSADPGDWVRGEVFQLNDPPGILETLDQYEGPEFERVATSATLSSGRELTAWVYVYKGTNTGHRVLSGDWLA